jgi:hypothetical protein
MIEIGITGAGADDNGNGQDKKADEAKLSVQLLHQRLKGGNKAADGHGECLRAGISKGVESNVEWLSKLG